MSGGVDSSVAALLMKEAGYDCTGATMRLYRPAAFQSENPKGCCSDRDEDDAAFVCHQLGIPHESVCFSRLFEQQVIRKFIAEYEAGRTPNPCIDCNRYLKFDALFRWRIKTNKSRRSVIIRRKVFLFMFNLWLKVCKG